MSGDLPEAKVRAPSRYSLVWLVPLIAAGLAIYLGWATLAARGPLITITFPDGRGLTAGETKIEHKGIAIGTVETVSLADHGERVVASVRVAKSAAPMMTTNARFWIVRPQFSLTDLSGLQTLISGSYIAIDPGPPGGEKARQFTGLSQPPAVRSDQPGTTFTLEAPRLGWLHEGAPVFYRDIPVGELLGYDERGAGKPIRLRVFIRAPYDHYVRSETHFWNTSGLAMNVGPTGVHVAVESIQALFAGGVSFANFASADRSSPPASDEVFTLYGNYDEAQNAGFRDNIQCVAYFDQSVVGLQAGSAVQMYGIRVGTVTGTQLELDPKTYRPYVRVTFDIQPERVNAPGPVPKLDPLKVAQELVKLGMRARIDTANLLTGQDVIGLDMVPDAPSAVVTTEGKRIVWPSGNGGFHDLTNSVAAVMDKLQRLPLDRMGINADEFLASLRALTETANNDLMPLGKKLPLLSRDLENTLHRANRLLGSMQDGYGADSQMNASLRHLSADASRTLASVRRFTDYLDQHPASLVWGR